MAGTIRKGDTWVGGRRSTLNAVIGTRDDGSKITTRSAILDWLEQGLPFDTSISHAGISRATANNWLRDAARAQKSLEINPKAKLTPQERDLIVFARQVDEAQAKGEARYWKMVNDLATGTLTRSIITIKTELRNGAQVEIERSTRVERMLPSLAANVWILRERYDRRKSLADRVSDDTVLSEEEAATHLADAMELWLSEQETTSGNGSAPP